MMTDLKPCPFCGSDAQLDITSCDIWPTKWGGQAQCKVCGATAKSAWSKDYGDAKSAATENWNRRQAEPKQLDIEDQIRRSSGSE